MPAGAPTTARRAAALLVGALLLAVATQASARPPDPDGVVDLLTHASAEMVSGTPGFAAIGGGGGDVDGDGLDDHLVAVPDESPLGRARAGATWVLPGRRAPVDVDLADPAALPLGRIVGVAPFDGAGSSLAVVGDVNGDGRADIAVGAPGADAGGAGSGSVFVVFGRPGLGEVDLAALGAGGIRIDGAGLGQSVGETVAPAGDVNGDGLADVLVGARVFPPGAPGAVHVVFGRREAGEVSLANRASAAARLTVGAGFAPSVSLDGAGDVDGDGLDDVVVAAGEGAWIVYGRRAFGDLDLTAPGEGVVRIRGSALAPGAFVRVAGAGDMDGDGFAEVALGAGLARKVHIVRGGRARRDVDLDALVRRGTTFVAAEDDEVGAGGLFGVEVAGVGDVDGDGRGDLGVGAVGTDYPGRGDSGAAFIVLGGPDLFGEAVRRAVPANGLLLVGPSARSGVRGIAPAGDADGDGRDDVLLAGRVFRGVPTPVGAAWLYGYDATRPCALAPRPGGRAAGGTPGRVRLDAEQLLINQRVGQAAIRRLEAVRRRLDEGLEGRDVCGGAVSSPKLSTGIAATSGPPPAAPPPRADPRPLAVGAAGEGAGVTLSARQLRINQRIYRVALLRARALATRLAGRLTGGDLAPGALGPGQLTPGLVVNAPGPVSSAPPSSAEARLPARGTAKVTVTARQLRINQRIAQTAVREANDLVAQLERGIVAWNLAERSVGTDALATPR